MPPILDSELRRASRGGGSVGGSGRGGGHGFGAVLDAHLAKQRQIANDREAETRARARLERLRSQAAQLEALIDGTLDVAVDPASLLRIDLSDAHELGDEQRLARLLGSEATDGESNPAVPDTAPAWAPSDELAKALAEAEAALDSQRMRFMALDGEQRAAVLATHQARQQEAEDQLAVEELIEDAPHLPTGDSRLRVLGAFREHGIMPPAVLHRQLGAMPPASAAMIGQ